MAERKFKVGDRVRFLPKYAYQAPGILVVGRTKYEGPNQTEPAIQFFDECGNISNTFHFEWAFEFAPATEAGAEEYEEIMSMQEVFHDQN